jgi:hypothetical protein
MRKLILCCLLAIVSFRGLQAQWRQMQDTSLFNRTINSCTSIGGELFAATGTGIYVSGSDSLCWRHRSPFYTSSNNIATIGNTLFVLSGGVAYNQFLLKSDDRGYTWDTVSTPFSFYGYSPKLYSLGSRIGIIASATFLYSDDKGKSWDKIIQPDSVVRSIIMANGYFIKREDLNANNGYYISLDGISYDLMCQSFAPIEQNTFLKDADSVFFISYGAIFKYYVKTHQVSKSCKAPIFEGRYTADTFARIAFFNKKGSAFYLVYDLYTDSSNMHNMCLFVSEDEGMNWVKTDEMRSVQQLLSYSTPPVPWGFITSDGEFIIDTRTNKIKRTARSISYPVALFQLGDKNIDFMSALAGRTQINENSGLDYLPPLYPFGNYLDLLEPLDADESNHPHNRIMNPAGTSVSEDAGSTWHLLNTPAFGGSEMHILGYTSSVILACNDSVIVCSKDSGHSWSVVKADLRGLLMDHAFGFQFNDQYFFFTQNSQIKNLYQVLESDNSLLNINSFGSALAINANQSVCDFFVNRYGNPVVITADFRLSDRLTCNAYTLDTASALWMKTGAFEITGRTNSSAPFHLGDKIMFSQYGKGLMVSSDYGKSFQADNTFPEGVIVNPVYQRLCRIGNTVYAGTNNGIWYNADLLSEDSIVIDSIKPLPGLLIYPNPARSDFNVSFTSNTSQQVSMYLTDMNGRSCSNSSYPAIAGANTMNISATNLHNGMYILQLKTTERVYVAKIVVE